MMGPLQVCKSFFGDWNKERMQCKCATKNTVNPWDSREKSSMNVRQLVLSAAKQVGIPPREMNDVKIIMKNGEKPIINFTGGPHWTAYVIGPISETTIMVESGETR